MLFWLVTVSLFAVGTTILVQRWWGRGTASKRVSVIVLGDFGRSPRMQFHAGSLAENGFDVDVIAYTDTPPHDYIANNPKIAIHGLVQPWRLPAGWPSSLFLLYAIVKVLWQTAQLVLLLLRVPRPSQILVQNPPSLPTLFCAWLVSRVRGCTVVVDWHNLGYSILAMGHGQGSAIVAVYRAVERVCGRLCDSHLCVTDAMKEWLAGTWGITATTLHDRPPAFFRRQLLDEQHEFWERLAPHIRLADGTVLGNRITTIDGQGKVLERNHRPAVLVSSTSWTDDEDFSVLLEALEKYDKAHEKRHDLPSLVCLVTGKGPNKKYYEDILAKKDFQHVSVATLWVEASDYPRLLGSADLGVSLHWSSSGLDLPMKVVDMFGCKLPVCARNFSCLDELVTNGLNGLVFDNSDELLQCLEEALHDFDSSRRRLSQLREGVMQSQATTWDMAWGANALPHFG